MSIGHLALSAACCLLSSIHRSDQQFGAIMHSEAAPSYTHTDAGDVNAGAQPSRASATSESSSRPGPGIAYEKTTGNRPVIMHEPRP